MPPGSPNTLIELHSAAQAFLVRRTIKEIAARDRLRAAVRQVLLERAVELPPGLARDGEEAFSLLIEAVARCRFFCVPWDKVVQVVNREWEEKRTK